MSENHDAHLGPRPLRPDSALRLQHFAYTLVTMSQREQRVRAMRAEGTKIIFRDTEEHVVEVLANGVDTWLAPRNPR